MKTGRWAVLLSACGMAWGALAAPANVASWLADLHQAPKVQTYSGTLVINVGDQMATARIAHALDEGQVVERVDVLTGEVRTTFRQGDQVITVAPQAKLWTSEQRRDLGVFPALDGRFQASVDDFYRLRILADDRVAGRLAHVVEVEPTDAWRWGYRIWRDAATGLMLKQQVLDQGAATVLEQSAFTTLEVPVHVGLAQLKAQLQPAAGYTVRRITTRTVDPKQWGLRMNEMVPGFLPVRAQLPAGQIAPAAGQPLQWVFSDGLASVSVFYEPLKNTEVPPRDRGIRQGATHTLLREQAWMRLTLVGEVPLVTLQRMAQALVVGPTGH